MKRNALTMDAKDWIIMRLMRVIAESSVNLTCHLDYCNAALWIAHNIEMCPGENDPFDMLCEEARRRKPAPSIDPYLMTGFPAFSQQQLDAWAAEDNKPPPECLITSCMEHGK